MAGYLSKQGIKVKVYPYERFMGLDTSRDKYSMDSGDNQHLTVLNNAFVDWRGAIVKDPELERRNASEGIITHINFYGKDLAAWTRKDGGGLTLITDNGVNIDEAFDRNAVVSSVVFNQKLIFAARGNKMRAFTGHRWEDNKSPKNPMPAYITAVSARLAMAGMAGSPTEVWFSRVDDENVMPGDEDPATFVVTKAVKIDIKNVLGTAEKIMGLGVFEQNILAIFCEDQTILYQTSVDYTQWQLADRANIKVGTISHNTIARANTELLFCSRSGVYSITRSRQNGITIYQQAMSSKIERLYRDLVRLVPNKEDISAYFDQDTSQYHIYFPRTDKICTRLTLTFNQLSDDEPHWSMGNFMGERCGAVLAGTKLIGTSGGVYRQGEEGDRLQFSPSMEVETPVLWHGAMHEQKQSHMLLIQAIGSGRLDYEARDETGKLLEANFVELDEEQNDGTFFVPLPRQYERSFQHIYKGVQLKFKSSSSGPVKIVGFAIFVRSE